MREDQKNTEKRCFIITPIGEPNSEVREQSDTIFAYIISPVVAGLGYKPIRADQIEQQGIITKQVIEHIIECPLVIADLTGHNPNVFYELAIRHVTRKPFVQIIKKGEKIPFDVASARTIQFDLDIKSGAQAKIDLENQIKSFEEGDIDTPISTSLDLKSLKESENPQQRSLADLVETISELRGKIMDIEEKLSDPKSILPTDYLYKLLKYSSYQEVILEARNIVNSLSIKCEQNETIDRDELRFNVQRLNYLLKLIKIPP